MFDMVLNIPLKRRTSKKSSTFLSIHLKKHSLEGSGCQVIKTLKLIFSPSVSLHESPGFNGFP